MTTFNSKVAKIEAKIAELRSQINPDPAMRNRGQPWSQEDAEFLRKHYADGDRDFLVQRLGRPIRAISLHARKLGLRRSKEYLENQSNRFKPGHKTWNKGKPGSTGNHPNSRRTQFKKGNKPHTWQPIGFERITKDGYLERKITDTGVTRNDFVAVHRIVWEEAHGPIPEGHVVVFRSDNKLDHRLENLELISRTELMLRNSRHNYPPELIPAMAQVSQLRKTIKEAEDELID